MIPAFNELLHGLAAARPDAPLVRRGLGELGYPTGLMDSILAATGATAIAIVLRTLAAMAVQRYSFFGRETVSFLLILPIALPGVVTGIALSSTFQTFGVEFGLMTIIVGHATFCIAVAYNNVIARPAAAANLRGRIGRPRRRHADHVPPHHHAWDAERARIRRAAGVRPVVRRGHRHGSPPAPARRRSRFWVLAAAMQRPTELPVVNVVAVVLIPVSVIPVYIATRISGAESVGKL